MEVKPGYKQTELGVIPEEWDVRACVEVCVKIQDGTHFSPSLGGNDYLYITSKNIGFGVLDVFNADRINAAQHKAIYKRCDVRHGDLLLTKDGANTGNVALNTLEEEFSLLSSVAFLRFDPKRHAAGYFLQQILSNPVQRQIKDAMVGNAITRLTLEKIRKLRFSVPPLPEQRAIAGALGDVDALLGALEKLIAKKRDLKQAAMQELLGGQKRLPGFTSEWEVKRLGGVVHLIASGVYGEEKLRGGLLASHVATTANIEEDDTWNEKEMSVRYFSEEQIHQYSTVEGDLIVVKSSGSAAKIQSGKIGFVDSKRAGKFLFSNFLMLLRPTAIAPRFLYFYLCSHNVKKLLPTLVEASTYPNIRLGDYLDLEIPVPSDDEQTAIAEVLSDMDAEISALEQRLAKTRALKQGMMQELLTGKTRLI